MTFRYSVGLNNVGSYQVSGRPWCKHLTTSGATNGLIEFPTVVDNLFAHFDDNGLGHTVKFAFCEPKRAIDFSSTNEYLTSTFPATDQLTVSAWVKLDGTINGVIYVEILGGNVARIQTTGAGNLRLKVGSNNGDTPVTSIGSIGEWVNLTITVNGTVNKIYLNGNFVIENTSDAGSGHNQLSIGGDGTSGYDGIYDELALFSTALNDAEVSELYNTGKTLKTTSHSRASDLVSRWDFEDNNYKSFYSTPDTTGLIYDRVSGNNLSLTNGSNLLSFVDGRLIENALDRHSIELSGHEQTTITSKIKQIFYSTSNSSEFSICASLTNIPAQRMYDLTGPGIDE